MRPIIEGVFRLYGIKRSAADVREWSRDEVQVRRACCWAARQLLPAARQREIARVLGISVLSTVTYDVAAFEKLREEDGVLRRHVDQLIEALRQ